MNKKSIVLAAFFAGFGLFASEAVVSQTNGKGTPDSIVKKLASGNERFANDKSERNNLDSKRRELAANENQSKHATVTVLSCSDSRVPVEHIFDAGIMELFVIRVPGNIFRDDEVAGAEYGVNHVATPVLMVLGHSDCGAVTAAVASVKKQLEHPLEKSIERLLEPVCKTVGETVKKHPTLAGKELIDACIEENVYAAIYELFDESDSIRESASKGKLKVVGGVYDLKTGKVRFLDDKKIAQLLEKAVKDEDND